jgi:serine/threonine-protein kinase
MPGKVKLEVVEGSMLGKQFLFEEHDTFLFGRMPDCHACFPDDERVSRHHFILEVNPPDACLRDLGSLNGTHVNGNKCGSREKDETPEEGAKRQYPEVALKHGDQVRVGETVLRVQVEVPAMCCQCSHTIPDAEREKCAWIGGTFICAPCKAKLAASAQPAKKPEPIRCQKCGKDVSKEVGQGQRGDYMCESCRNKPGVDPMEVVGEMLRKAGLVGEVGKALAIPGYEIEKKLAEGGFGAAYLARRKQDNQRVAIKVMLSRIAVDEDSRKKFLREIETTKSLKHEHIVPLFDHGSAGSAFYFVMEFCEGGDVANQMARRGGKLTLTEAGPIMLHALDGLAFAHSKGFVHRDLKPHNLLLRGTDARWTTKVSDFGLAKNFQQAGYSGHTMTGSYAGTPPFMPREQVTNFKYVRPVSDVWSIGATFYNMLTSRFPLDFVPGKDPLQLILHGSVVPLRQRDPSLPKKLAEVIDRSLAQDMKARYQNAGELRDALVKAL